MYLVGHSWQTHGLRKGSMELSRFPTTSLIGWTTLHPLLLLLFVCLFVWDYRQYYHYRALSYKLKIEVREIVWRWGRNIPSILGSNAIPTREQYRSISSELDCRNEQRIAWNTWACTIIRGSVERACRSSVVFSRSRYVTSIEPIQYQIPCAPMSFGWRKRVAIKILGALSSINCCKAAAAWRFCAVPTRELRINPILVLTGSTMPRFEGKFATARSNASKTFNLNKYSDAPSTRITNQREREREREHKVVSIQQF